MNDLLLLLLGSAATVGFAHTLIGVDHSVPFLVLAKTRNWTLARTLWVTFVCGFLHVLSSALIAAVGLSFGFAGQRLAEVEETRGTWAAWLLVALGVAYALVSFWRSRAPSLDDLKWDSADRESADRMAVDGMTLPTNRLLPALFVVFALGPCEALLPLLTASGMSLDFEQSLLVTGVFSAATLATMLALVSVGYLGLARTALLGPGSPLRQHVHTIAGLTLAASGLGVQLLGI